MVLDQLDSEMKKNHLSLASHYTYELVQDGLWV